MTAALDDAEMSASPFMKESLMEMAEHDRMVSKVTPAIVTDRSAAGKDKSDGSILTSSKA